MAKGLRVLFVIPVAVGWGVGYSREKHTVHSTQHQQIHTQHISAIWAKKQLTIYENSPKEV